MVEKRKRAKHYKSTQRILLVGEGDFSFSLCLANAFGSAAHIIATSLDSRDTVVKMYDKGKENLENLMKLGATIYHEIDATKMELHPKLWTLKFNIIIFNFPHAGFIGKEDNVEVIKQHQELVNGFFKNASRMLQPCGEVHVSHRIDYPYNMWKLKELASSNSLVLTECVNFDIYDYPGYSNKRGAEPESNKSFPLGECRTFKFQVANPHKIYSNKTESMDGFEFINFYRTWVDNSCYLESFGNSHLPATPVYYPQEGIMNTLRWLPGSGIPKRHRGCSDNLEELRRRRSLRRREWQRDLIRKHGKEK